MTGILKNFPFAIAYIDDIIIFSKTPQEHLSHIRMVFEKLKSANLSMKKSRCSFFSKEIQYLGHFLSATSIMPLPAKTHAIQHMQPPMTPKQVRAFHGLVGYYRKFIRGFAKIAKPLTSLTRQQVNFEWTPEHHTAFLHLKEAIVQFKHLSCTTPTLTRGILSTQMLQMTPVEHNSCKNTMVRSSQEHFYHTLLQKPNGNGVLLNRKPMAYIMP